MTIWCSCINLESKVFRGHEYSNIVTVTAAFQASFDAQYVLLSVRFPHHVAAHGVRYGTSNQQVACRTFRDGRTSSASSPSLPDPLLPPPDSLAAPLFLLLRNISLKCALIAVSENFLNDVFHGSPSLNSATVLSQISVTGMPRPFSCHGRTFKPR